MIPCYFYENVYYGTSAIKFWRCCITYGNNCVLFDFVHRVKDRGRGADKSLVRPGKKEATATKLGIYLTYSPRSSIHFLARCFNFYKPLKKKFRILSVQPGLCGSIEIRVGRKMATFQWWTQRAHVRCPVAQQLI